MAFLMLFITTIRGKGMTLVLLYPLVFVLWYVKRSVFMQISRQQVHVLHLN